MTHPYSNVLPGCANPGYIYLIQSVTNCHRLKLEATDGKKYFTDTANAETLLRLVQSMPSPKAEPIKLWLAKVGYERFLSKFPNHELARSAKFELENIGKTPEEILSPKKHVVKKR